MRNRLSSVLILIVLTSVDVLRAQSVPDSLRLYRLKEVVVTGSRVEVSRQNVPFTVSVVTQDEIRQAGKTNILPVLSRQVPGLFISERGLNGFGVSDGSAGKVYIRGAGGDPTRQVLFLIDGQPQYVGLFSHPLSDMYVTSDIEKVEIIRGPASILYGSNAMGGAINLITKTQKQDGLSLNGQIQGGSYNTFKAVGSAGYRKDAISFYVSANRNQTDGHRDSSKFDITNAYLKTGYDLSRHFSLSADYSVAKFRSHDPGPASAPYGNHWIDIIRHRAAFGVDNRYGKSEGAVKVFYNYGDHDIFDGFRSTDYMTGITAYQSLKLFDGNIITFGTDYKTYGGKAKNINSNTLYTDTSRYEIGLYGMIQHTFVGKLTLNSGLRMEHHEGYGGEWIPQAGFAYAYTPNTVVKGSVAKGFRSPAINEQFMFPPQNADLKPERMINYELGFIQKFPESRLQFEITGFLSDGKNMIQREMVNSRPKLMNTGTFSMKGIEWTADYRPCDNLFFSANYSYLETKDPMLGAPKHKLYTGGSYQWNKFSFHLNGQYIQHLYTKLPAGANQGWIEDYFLINGMLTYKAHRYFDVFINAENLADTRYTNLYDYPMPGTTLFIGINARY